MQRIRLLLGLIVVASLALLAQNKFTPPNVKEGLWELTLTHSTSGAPGGMPADALAQLPPEQRARVEEMMKQRGVSMQGNTTVVKNCVTKEKLAQGMAFGENRENCTHTIVGSSSSHMEMKLHCEDTKNGAKTTVDGNTVIDVVSSENVKGTTHVVTRSQDHTMSSDMSFTSKYLGPACGDVK